MDQLNTSNTQAAGPSVEDVAWHSDAATPAASGDEEVTWHDEAPATMASGVAESTADQIGATDPDYQFKLNELKSKQEYYSDENKNKQHLRGYPDDSVKEGLRRSFAGMEQFGIRTLEAMGVLKPGATDKFTVEENARQEDWDYRTRHQNPGIKVAGEVIGEFMGSAPLMFVPGGGAIKTPEAIQKAHGILASAKSLAYRYGARAGADAAIGGAASALQYAQSDNDRVSHVIFGALFSGGVRAAVETYSMLRPTNILQNMTGIRATLSSKTTKGGERLENIVGAPLNPSELTGGTDALSAELVARRGRGVQEIINTREGVQYGGAVNYLNDVMDSINKGTTPPNVIGERVQQAFDKVVNNIVNSRRAGWVRDMAAANAAAKGEQFIESGKLQSTLYSLIKELGNPLASKESQAVAKELSSDFRILGKPDKKLTIAEAQTLLAKYTEWGQGTGRILRDVETGKDRFVGAQLKDAFLNDLDATVKSSPNSKAVIALQRARDNYKLASADLDAVGNDVVTQLMNRNNIPAPEKFADIFKRGGIEASEVRSIMGVLNKQDPVAAKMLQRKWIEDALDKASIPNAKKMPGAQQFDPETFLKEMDFYSPQAKEVFTSGQRAKILAGVEYVRRITARGRGKVTLPEGSAGEITQTAQNVISMNMVFVAGQTARAIAPQAFAKMLFTDEGIKALKVLADPAKYPPTLVSEAIALTQSLSNDNQNKRKR